MSCPQDLNTILTSTPSEVFKTIRSYKKVPTKSGKDLVVLIPPLSQLLRKMPKLRGQHIANRTPVWY